MTWWTIGVLAVCTFLMRIAGPVVAGGRTPPPRLVGVIAMLTPALLTALVISQTFTVQGSLHVDAKAVGIAVALVGTVLRLPVTVVLVAAVAATALTRQVA